MRTKIGLFTLTLVFLWVLQGCGEGQASATADLPVEMPVTRPMIKTVSTNDTYTASVEGKNNIEIRPRVDGYIEKIYVDEGAYVKKGQLLFKINDNSYREMVSQVQAALLAAEAQRDKAYLELQRLTPLVEKKVVSDIQLRAAESDYKASQAMVAQAQAQLDNARTNLEYTVIKAPVDGYIGRIPYKEGALVGRSEPLALTNISEIDEMYAYFAMSEQEFLAFIDSKEGSTVEEKIKNLPEVDLQLPGGSVYPDKGRVQLIQGQFDKNIGAITLRASFLNKNGLLRSGMTGTIRVPRHETNALLIPQQATYEIQDKIFVFRVGTGNRVISTPVTVKGKKANYYIVHKGIAANDQLVLSGLGHLQDSAMISPRLVTEEALLEQNPLE